MPAYGFGLALGALVGQKMGEGRVDLADHAIRISLSRGIFVFTGIGLLYLCFPEFLCGIFLGEHDSRNQIMQIAIATLFAAAAEAPPIDA